MGIEHGWRDEDRCIVFEGSMTYANSRNIENFIIDLMRRYLQLSIDLSRVDEIDRCGVHFLAILKRIGGDAVRIVATSPAVDMALAHAPAFGHGRRGGHSRGNCASRKCRPASAQEQSEPCLRPLGEG